MSPLALRADSLVARLRSRATGDGKAGLSGGEPVCRYDRDLLLEAAAEIERLLRQREDQP